MKGKLLLEQKEFVYGNTFNGKAEGRGVIGADLSWCSATRVGKCDTISGVAHWLGSERIPERNESVK